MNIIIALSVIALLFFLCGFAYAIIKFKQKKSKTTNNRPKKIKLKTKEKKNSISKNKNGKLETKGSYCDTVDKFLYRKEIKLFILINKALPKGYIAFPRIGVDTILEPVGSRALYDSIKGQYVDLVIFEQETMKPKIVVDVYDGSIGDEQLDIESPQVIEALKSAELPVVYFKVKSDYTVDEIKEPILKILEPQEENSGDEEGKVNIDAL